MPRTVLNEILSVNVDGCDLQLCFASLRDDDIPDIQLVQATEDVMSEFKKITGKTLAIKKRANDKGDLVLKDYEAQAKLDSYEIEHLDLAINEPILNQISGLANIAGMDIFNADDDFVSMLRFYVVVLHSHQAEPIYFFRTYTAKKELKRSAWFAMWYGAGQYNKVVDNLFLFDQYIDCIVQGNDLFIFNKNNFQKIFRFYELLIATAEETLGVIQKQIPIDNFDEFKEACKDHLIKLAKLKNIASRPYLQKLTMQDIKHVIAKYELPIQTTGDGEAEKIVYDPSDQWAILRLLDDHYLESVMTGNSYEVNSKREMQ